MAFALEKHFLKIIYIESWENIAGLVLFHLTRYYTAVFHFFFLFGAYLVYNVVLISGYSSECLHMYTLFFHVFPCRHYRLLRRLACTMQQALICCLFHMQQCVYVSLRPSVPIYPLLSPRNHKCVFYIYDSTSVLSISSFVSLFFLDSTYT